MINKIIKPDFKSTLKEDRVFHPSKKFSANAHIKNMAEYTKLYNESIKKPEVFWAREAENLEWFKK